MAILQYVHDIARTKYLGAASAAVADDLAVMPDTFRVAVVAFLALIIEICALVFACVIRFGQPGNKDRYSDRA